MLLLYSTETARFSLIHLLLLMRAAFDTQWISKEYHSSENYLIATVDAADGLSEKWSFFYY